MQASKHTSSTSQVYNTEHLPNDVDLLKQMVRCLLDDLRQKDRQALDLKSQLEVLKRRLFGRRSETLDRAQLALFEGLIEQVAEEQTQNTSPADEQGNSKPSASRSDCGARKNNGHGRKPLPKHLPRQRIEHHPPEEDRVCSCCGKALRVIGEEVTEELDYIPASFVVREHARVKYACRACQENVVIGVLPPRPIEKGRPGTGLLAHVLTSKYCDHLPLNRLEGIFARHGVDIARSTMCDWVRDAALLLEPIVAEMKRRILLSKKLHTDDTPVPVRDESCRQTRKGYLWVYLDGEADVAFDYTPNRSRAGPLAFLGDYSGYVQADAYSGYDEYFKKSGATEVGCWAHARRKFYDARFDDRRRCTEMLALIGKLYEVEREAKELDADTRRALRQERSRPILDEIEERLNAWSVEMLPKSPQGKAVTYARNQWSALTRYLDDGDLAIDNNAAERTLRMVAVGRKNWLFAGSDAGGERAAVIYSLVSSCKLAGIDPFAYLRDVLDRVSTHPASRIADLTPAGWKANLRPDSTS